MKKKTNREIGFVLSRREVELLMEIDSRFFEEFSGKKIAEQYEFSYSYEALLFLKFELSFAAKARFNPVLRKIKHLLALSNSFSQTAIGKIQSQKNRLNKMKR